MVETGAGGGQGTGKKADLLKPVTATVPKLKELPPDAAEDLLKKSGFPTGSGRIAQAGWTGNTPVTKDGIARLKADAEAEAESQQGNH